MGSIGEDPHWDAFSTLHDYILQAYPLMWVSTLQRA